MNTPLVSVIVPVYNVEKTLARCLESICGQSYQNLEIIVVNDGSPDGSFAICEQFRAKDPRVVVISKENEGLSLTRNAGMRAAHGKYLQFVDSDDYIEPTFTARMVEAAEKNYADLVVAPYWMVIPLASSKSGQRTEKLFELINFVNDQSNMRISTGMLNNVLADAQARVQPPTDKGRRLKIYYMTQTGIKPPNFVIFCNSRELFHFSYQRYIENQLRTVFGLEGTPIRIVIRQKGDKE